MNARPPVILDRLASLADSTRSRILLLLDGQELSVSELCTVLQLPQSTVSRHLKALGDAGWVTGRAEGTSNVYAMSRDGMDSSTKRLWSLVRGPKVLEVGVGTGKNIPFYPNGMAITAIDLTPGMLARAQRRA